MMALAVAQDYPTPSPLDFPKIYKVLLSLSIAIPTVICTLSLTQLGKTSAYVAPVVSALTILHALIVGILCYRASSSLESPASPRRGEQRSVTTRGSNLIASYALYVLWIVTFVLVVIAASNAAHWVLSPIHQPRATVEAVFTGVQACVTLVFAVLCTRDRRRLHASTRRRRSWADWFQS